MPLKDLIMIKHKKTGKGYIFWIARVDSELPNKDNSVKMDKIKGKAWIKELGL